MYKISLQRELGVAILCMQQHHRLLWSKLQPDGSIVRPDWNILCCHTTGILSACLMQFARQCCPTTAQPKSEDAERAALTSGLCSLQPGTAYALQCFHMILAWALCSLAEAALLQHQIHILMLPLHPRAQLPPDSRRPDTSAPCSWQAPRTLLDS